MKVKYFAIEQHKKQFNAWIEVRKREITLKDPFREEEEQELKIVSLIFLPSLSVCCEDEKKKMGKIPKRTHVGLKLVLRRKERLSD